MRERRRHCRIPFHSPIEITWTENGEAKLACAEFIDISVGGLRIESPVPVPEQADLTLKVVHINFSGSASVRHIRPSGSKFILGLELSKQTSKEILGFLSQPEMA